MKNSIWTAKNCDLILLNQCVQKKNHIWNNNFFNRHKTSISHQCHEIQKFYHFKNERFISQTFIKQTISNVFTRFFLSQQLNQLNSYSIDVQNFFNFLKIEHHINVDNASDIISKKITCFSNFTIFYVFTLSWTKSFSSRQSNLTFIYFQLQNCERAKIIKSTFSQLIFQNDNSNTQYFVCDKIKHIEFNMISFTSFISQFQSFFSNSFLLFDFYSTTSQTIFDTKNQYLTMIFETKNDFLQISIDVQIESKIANDKRKRNAIIFQRFRQRRKKKTRNFSKNFEIKTTNSENNEEKKILWRKKKLLSKYRNSYF